jgi:hypothetical protein
MANEQEKAVGAQGEQPAKVVLPAKRKTVEGPRWVRDALEDDDVREALKGLHTSGDRSG